MKKIRVLILGLCTLFILGNSVQAKDYEYKNLDIIATIQEDGTINVLEKYTADFFVMKHGIIRTIPFNYTVDGKKFHINIDNINVEGKAFTTGDDWREETIKIGDANIELIGEQDYPISYDVYGLIRNFSGFGYAELYWNLVGNKFDTNFNNVDATIILPKPYTGFTENDFQITTDGTIKTVEEFAGSIDWSQGDKIVISYSKTLPAYQGITLAIKFPNDYFVFDHEKQASLVGDAFGDDKTVTAVLNIVERIDNNTGLFTLGVLLLFIGVIVYPIILLKKLLEVFLTKLGNSESIKREYREKYPVIIQYTPPKGLNSAEVGLLLHRYPDAKDLFSLIYKWAYEGLITMKEGKRKNIILQKLKEIPIEYPEYEKYLFNKLFLEDEIVLNNKTLKSRGITGDGLENQGIREGWVIRKTSGMCGFPLGMLYIFLVFIGAPLLFVFNPIVAAIYAWTLIIMILVSGRKILFPKTLEETEKGAKLIAHILGFKKFLKACDENQLKTFLDQDPLYFDKVLPYAVVFGLDTKLIKKMTPFMKKMSIIPTGYIGDIDSFRFMNDKLIDISSSSYPTGGATSSSYPSYSSSSGFDSGSSFSSDSGSDSSFDSGGGGGGGGGSSW